MKHLLAPHSTDPPASDPVLKSNPEWKQFLLASETGSGKSIAYLLPLLQSLKQTEAEARIAASNSTTQHKAMNPRALILAPTHELSRQLSGFAKALLHQVKLRVLCASKANVPNVDRVGGERKGGANSTSASQMKAMFDATVDGAGEFGEFGVKKSHPVDVVVGTPMKLLEMVRGRGWDRKPVEVDSAEDTEDKEEKLEKVEAEEVGEDARKLRRGRDKMAGFGTWKAKGEMGLENVEWVIVDEADVLFG